METAQKKVTFNNRVKRRFIERAPCTEQTNLWYSASENAEARERERVIRSCIQQEDYSQIADNLISEGIRTIQERAIQDITIDTAISAVLDEQERQQQAEDDNDETFVLNDNEIAQEYRVHSRVSLAQAQNRARRHARYVRDIDSQPDEVLPPPPPRQGSSTNQGSRSPTLTKSKMSLARRRNRHGRQVLRREDAPHVVKCTTPAA